MNAPSKSMQRLSSGDLDIIQEVLNAVDERGKELDRKWGLGRLPALCGIEWAEKFASQSRKFSAAIWAWDLNEARKHGEAMLRAYAKLDEIATAAGCVPGPPEQWEFMTPNGLVILIRDINRMNQVETGGRKCQVWSLDEIANVIRKHPEIAMVKNLFPGAEVERLSPKRAIVDQLDDSLEGMPV